MIELGVLGITESIPLTSGMKELTGEGLVVVTATESDGVERKIAHSPCFPLFVAPHAAGFRPLTRKIKS